MMPCSAEPIIRFFTSRELCHVAVALWLGSVIRLRNQQGRTKRTESTSLGKAVRSLPKPGFADEQRQGIASVARSSSLREQSEQSRQVDRALPKQGPTSFAEHGIAEVDKGHRPGEDKRRVRLFFIRRACRPGISRPFQFASRTKRTESTSRQGFAETRAYFIREAFDVVLLRFIRGACRLRQSRSTRSGRNRQGPTFD